MAWIEPTGLRLLLAFLSLAPILWGTRVLLAARTPPAGLSRPSLELLRSRATADTSPVRRYVDSILRQLHALETAVRRGRDVTGSEREREVVDELGRIQERLHELVEQAVRSARTEGSPDGSDGTGDERDRV